MIPYPNRLFPMRQLLSIFSMVVFSVGAVSKLSAASQSTHTAAEVLLVYNSDSPISTALGKDYAAKRGVTKKVIVRCADSAVKTENETISFADYTAQIASPVGAYLKQHPEINFIILTKGVPIRIDGAATGSRDEHTTGNWRASVDSYLAAMGYSEMKGAVKIKIHGSGADGLAWLNRYWKADEPFSHSRFGGYLVTRLDGYTQADAKALVARSLAAEQPSAPVGKVLFDVQPIFKFKPEGAANQPFDVTGDIPDESDYGTWNADMVKAADVLKAKSLPYELETTESFVGDRANLLGYFSWGSNDPKFTAAAYESLRFAPGSVGDKAVSTSARTFLPTTGGQSLIADLISHGITGIKGYTDEPLLQAIASPSILIDRYCSGFTLAESFYAASRFVGWTDVVIGDPLAHAPASLHRKQ